MNKPGTTHKYEGTTITAFPMRSVRKVFQEPTAQSLPGPCTCCALQNNSETLCTMEDSKFECMPSDNHHDFIIWLKPDRAMEYLTKAITK